MGNVQDGSDLHTKIVNLFHEALEARGRELLRPLADDALLGETGLDSLGFAILVVRLEEELGYDPFTMMDQPVYPTTFGEFFDIYSRFSHATQVR